MMYVVVYWKAYDMFCILFQLNEEISVFIRILLSWDVTTGYCTNRMRQLSGHSG